LFSIIALVLVGATVGGVRIIKARNDSYAASQRKVAQTDTKQQPQPAQQKADTSKSADTSKQPQSQDTSNKNSAVPPVTNPTPTPAASDTKSTSTPQPQQHSNLPATSSFTPGEALPTIVLMGLAGFFGSKLLRARADYRRYIGL